jgi:zinc protease
MLTSRRHAFTRVALHHVTGIPMPLIPARSPWFATLVYAALLLAVTLQPASVSAQMTPPPVGITAGPSAEGISEYRLENGLKVLLFPDKSKALTLVNITYLVGSKHESYGETGMAHLLEHLVFKGTPKNPDMLKEFTTRGMRWNGTTSTERTNYYEQFSANPEHLRFAIALEADRMVNSFIAKKDLDSEMTVVRNEFERRDNNPAGVMFERLNAAAYSNHNYGKPTIGVKSDIENVSIERLQAFYKTHYQPDNAVLLIAGNFDERQALAWVAEFFSVIPKPTRVLPTLYTVEPAQDGEREVTLRRVGDIKLFAAAYKAPSSLHADSAAFKLLAAIMTKNPVGPLYRALVETKKVTQLFPYSAGGIDASLAGFGLVADKAADLAPLETELLNLVEGRTEIALTQAELDRVRAEVLVGFDKAMESPISVGLAISEVVASGDWRTLFAGRDALLAVTLADLQRVKTAYFKPTNRTIARFIPEDKPDRVDIPDAPTVASLIAAYKPRAVVDAGEAFSATPETLEARTVRELADPTFKSAELRKQNRGNAVSVVIGLQWGELAEQLKQPALSMVASLLWEGASAAEKQARIDALTALKSRVSISGSSQGATVTINSDRDNVMAAMKLALPLLRNPSFDAGAFERLKKQWLTFYASSAREPQTVLNNLAIPYKNKAFGVAPGEPHYRLTLAEQIDEINALTYDAVVKSYAANWGATQVRVSVVGSAPDGVPAEAKRLLKGWASKAPAYVRHQPKHQALNGTTFIVEVPDKTNALVDIDQYLPMNRLDPDAEALRLAVQIFGGNSLDNRLSARIRQKDGLSYSINAALSLGDFGDRAHFGIQGSYAPQYRERVLAAIREELDRAQKDGFTEAEFSRAKESAMQSRQQIRNSDASIAGALMAQLEDGETFAASAKRDAQIMALTLAQVNDAFKKYIKADAWVIGVAGDFAKAAADAAKVPTK